MCMLAREEDGEGVGVGGEETEEGGEEEPDGDSGKSRHTPGEMQSSTVDSTTFVKLTSANFKSKSQI